MSSTDFIIVGAGLSGLVVASRLTENPNISVTVLEAGGETFHGESIDVPANLVGTWGNPSFDWTFLSVPQKHADDRVLYMPRGKSVGGSTLLAVGELTRAGSIEYDAFAELGNKGWNWDEFLRYMKKSESFHNSPNEAAKYGMKFEPSAHGNGGPLQKTFPQWLDIFVEPGMQALKSVGIPVNPDPSAGENVGAFIAVQAIDQNAARSSAATAYYEPIRSRPNLQIISHARVTKLITDSTPGQEILIRGIEYSQEDVTKTLNATKEVILCAGAFQTPQILELSGIGNRAVLEKLGLPVMLELPGVGENYQDHLALTCVYKAKQKLQTFDIVMNDPEMLKEQKRLYTEEHRGMLGAVPSLFSFMPMAMFDKDGSLVRAASKLTLDSPSAAVQKTLEMQKSWVQNPKIPFMDLNIYDRFTPGPGAEFEPGKSYITFNGMTLHTFSRGSVHINSVDPLANPAIDLEVLDNDIDMGILVESVKLSRKLAEAESLKALIDVELSPGPAVQTDDEIKAFIRQAVGTTYHPVGTVGMLPKEDGGCVDTHLKVYGTANLRVVDASIIPLHLSAHLQTSLYAIAEKAADIIKAEM